MIWLLAIPMLFSAEIDLPKDQITIDDQLVILVNLKYPDTHTPDINAMRANLLQHAGVSEPPFVLISSAYSDTQATFVLEPQIGGIHALTFFEIPFLPKKDGEPVEVISEIFKVDVTVPEKKEDYVARMIPLISLTNQFPIEIDLDNLKVEDHSQHNIDLFHWKSFPWIYFIGLFLFGFLYLIARQLPKEEEEIDLRRQRALAKARAVKKLRVLSPKKEAYYSDLTNIVRHYIEERFEVNAPTQTTQEFLQIMTKHPGFNLKTQKMLSDFLISSDSVKFAEHHPTPKECQKAHNTAQEFILYT